MLLSKLSKYVEIFKLNDIILNSAIQTEVFFWVQIALSNCCASRDQLEWSLGPGNRRWILKLDGLQLCGLSLFSSVNRGGNGSQMSWVVALNRGRVF